MDAPQKNFVIRAGQQARILKDTFEMSQELATLYNGTPAWGTLITQELIDWRTSISGGWFNETSD